MQPGDNDVKLQSLRNWRAPESWMKITAVDAHTGGEPLRIITGGLPEIKGDTILEKRRYLKDHLDYIRKILMWEPRGHADMYGCIITPPVSADADFGVLFMHNEGYSTMCGHGIIAVCKVVVECGMIPGTEPVTRIRIDSPAGLIDVLVSVHQGKVTEVTFLNVPSFVVALQQKAEVPGIGSVAFDLAFGGAFYAFVQAAEIGLQLTANDYRPLIEKGMAIKRAVMNSFPIRHPFEDDLNFLYGTIFIGEGLTPGSDSRNVCVFADGEVDRSPTGTGVSARMAIHHARGELKVGESMVIESILGSRFTCRVAATTKFGPHAAVIPEIAGTAHISGTHTFIVDPDDPLKGGFIFR